MLLCLRVSYIERKECPGYCLCAILLAMDDCVCVHVYYLERNEYSAVCLCTIMRAKDILVFAYERIILHTYECSGLCLYTILRAIDAQWMLLCACVRS